MCSYCESIFYDLPWQFWFLWAVFYSSLIVLAVNRFCHDNIVVYIVLAVIMLLTPDLSRLQLYKFMYGYFIVGYMWANGRHRVNPANPGRLVAAFMVMCVIYAGLFRLYGRDCYIYTTGFSLLGKDMSIQLAIDIYRFVIGIVGSSVVILSAAILAYIFKTCEYCRCSLWKICRNCRICGEKYSGNISCIHAYFHIYNKAPRMGALWY